MTIVLVVIALLYGLIMGSFVNAWAWRLAHDEKISVERSACPQCGHPIRAYDNIPVVSWLLLRGRCRDCAHPISWRYPVGELVMAALYVAVVLYDGLSWLLIPHLVFVTALVLISEVDLETQIIPDVIVLPTAAIGLPLMIAFGGRTWWEWPVAGLAAAAALFVVREAYYRIRKIDGMGLGDVKLALCMGIYLGAAVVPALFIGFVSGAVIGVAVMTARKSGAQTALPFGPFLAAGAVLALFFGRALIAAYLGFAFPDR